MDEDELYSIDQHVGDGVTLVWEISFAGGYLDREHIKAIVWDTMDENGTLQGATDTEFTWIDDYTISITPAVAAGKFLRIYRDTPVNEPLVDFSDGSIINEVALDKNAQQAIFGIAELRDRFLTGVDVGDLYVLKSLVEDAAQAAQDAVATFQAFVPNGLATFVPGDQSSKVTSDPLKGKWIDPTGAGGVNGAWKRVDTPRFMMEDFGIIGDGVTDAYPKLQQMVLTLSTLYPTGYTITSREGSKFRLNTRVALDTGNVRITGSHFITDGTVAPFSINQGRTAAEAFTQWTYNVRIDDCVFEGITAAGAISCRATNVKRYSFSNNILINMCGTNVTHIARDTIYNTATGVAGAEGVGVDPAIVAGFSADPDSDDLCRDIEISGNFGDTGVYNGSFTRIEFARNVVISNNTIRGGKVSWWGGGAPKNEGGEAWMKRRVRNMSITGNYFSRVNGGINGNCSDGLAIVGNVCEDVADTCLDLEGCMNSTVTGNLVRNAGNFTMSIFYVSINNVFANNTLVQTKRAKNMGYHLNTTSYSSTATVTSSNGTDGRIRLTFASIHGFSSDQIIGIRLKSGAMGTALTSLWYPIVLVDNNNVELVGTEGLGGLAGGVTSIYFQRGNSFFAANLAGVTTGEDNAEVVINGNTFRYEGEHNYGIVGGDTSLRTMVFTNNRLRNVRVVLEDNSSKNLVTDNLLEFKSTPNDYGVPQRLLSSTGRIVGNTVKLLAGSTYPAGSTAIVSYSNVFSGTWAEARDNRVDDLATASGVTHMGISYNNGSNGNSFLIAGNVINSFADLNTAKGQARVRFEDNFNTSPTAIAAFPNQTHLGTLGGVALGTRVKVSTALGEGGIVEYVAHNFSYDTNTAWAASTAYAVNDIVYNGTQVYRCSVAGVSAASGGPTGTSTVVDGTVTWAYVNVKTIWRALSAGTLDAVITNGQTNAINIDPANYGTYIRTTLTANMGMGAPTSTGVEGQLIFMRFKDNGTSRNITWNAAFRSMVGILPTSTTAGKWHYMTFRYNAIDAVWDCMSNAIQP